MTLPLTLCPLLIALLAAPPLPSGQEKSIAEGPHFASPIRLTAGDESLGSTLPYPSPRLHDIDGDGAVEMVLGDLRGRVHVAERATGDDPMAWGELRPFKSDKRLLKFNNW